MIVVNKKQLGLKPQASNENIIKHEDWNTFTDAVDQKYSQIPQAIHYHLEPSVQLFLNCFQNAKLYQNPINQSAQVFNEFDALWIIHT